MVIWDTGSLISFYDGKMHYLKKLCLIIIFLFSVSIVSLHAQEKPRTAVIPLNPIEVSKADADTLTGLLETGLVNTDVFDVIEQTQAKIILETQSIYYPTALMKNARLNTGSCWLLSRSYWGACQGSAENTW